MIESVGAKTVKAGFASLLLLMLAAAACAPHRAGGIGQRSPECVPPLEPYLRVDLYTDRSNRNDPSGRLSDDEWRRFVEEVLVDNFPAGGTVLDNSGWWRRADGTTFHGVGRTLVILIPVAAVRDDRAPIREVIAQIKGRYGPSSVGWEEDWVCANF